MKRICSTVAKLVSAAALVLLASLNVAFAAEECGGTSLVTQLKQEQPEKYAEFRAEADKIENSGAILWKITPPDGAAPSYLFGTIHVSDPRVTKLPAEAEVAFDKAKVVALELKEAADPKKIVTAMAGHLGLMLLPAGKSLTGMLDDNSEEPVVKAALGKLGLPLSALDKMRPWVVATMLSIPRCEQTRAAKTEGALDTRLAKQALKDGKTLVGLETIGDQLEAFNAISLDMQKTFLVDTARVYDKVDDVFETLIELYLAHDVAALTPLMATITGKADYAEEMSGFNEALIERRNHHMATAAAPLIDKGDAFIAVGALHLPGKSGLVALLREAGYKVEPVN